MIDEIQKKNVKNYGNIIKINPLKRYFLYFSAISGLIAVFLIRRNLGAEYMLFSNFGIFKQNITVIPSSAIEWFNIYRTNRIVGFILSDFFDIINSMLVAILTTCIYILLKKEKKILISIAVTLSVLSTVLYFYSNNSFILLNLSKKYFLSTSVLTKEEILFNANKLFSINYITVIKAIAFNFALFLLFISGILVSFSMKNSKIFSKKFFVIGLIAHFSGLLYFIVLPFSKELIAIPISFSAPFIVIWYFIISIKLINFAKINKNKII